MDLSFVTSIHVGPDSLTEIQCSNGQILWRKYSWPMGLDSAAFWMDGQIKMAAYCRPDGVEIAGITGSRAGWNGKWYRTSDAEFNPVGIGVENPEPGGDAMTDVGFVQRVSGGNYYYGQAYNGSLMQVYTVALKPVPFPVQSMFETSPILMDTVYSQKSSDTFTFEEYVEDWDSETQMPVKRVIASGTGTYRYFAS